MVGLDPFDYNLSQDISNEYPMKKHTNTFSNGCLGSHNDEERSEMRYVMRIAKSSESSKLWTHLALLRKYVCWSVCPSQPKAQALWSRPLEVLGPWVSQDVIIRYVPDFDYHYFPTRECEWSRRDVKTTHVDQLHSYYGVIPMTVIRSDLQSVKITRWI